MSDAVNIDFLSSIPSETFQDSGVYGRAYDLQLDLARAERELDWTIETLHQQFEREKHTMGSLADVNWTIDNDGQVRTLRATVTELTMKVAERQAELGGIVFLPALTNLVKIEKKLAAYNRKAQTIGSAPITLTKTDETLLLNYNYYEDRDGSDSADFAHVFCVLTGETPKIEGFRFLAAIVPTEQGNIVNRIPHADETIDLHRFHSTGALCEHCNKIRSRKDCYVVHNETTGETLQVGRTCLRDYMGTNNPEAVLKALEMYRELESHFGAGGEREALSTMTFLIHCAAVLRVENNPYQLGGRGTANIFNQKHRRKDSRTGEQLWVDPIDADQTAAEAVLHWARVELVEPSEFEQNVKIALANDFVEDRFIGIAGAAFICREKWLKIERVKAERAQEITAPVIEGRILVTGEVISAKWRDSGYGETLKLTVRDDRGFKVWGSCPAAIESSIERGARVSFTAAIRKSDDDPSFGFYSRPTKATILKEANA